MWRNLEDVVSSKWLKSVSQNTWKVSILETVLLHVTWLWPQVLSQICKVLSPALATLDGERSRFFFFSLSHRMLCWFSFSVLRHEHSLKPREFREWEILNGCSENSPHLCPPSQNSTVSSCLSQESLPSPGNFLFLRVNGLYEPAPSCFPVCLHHSGIQNRYATARLPFWWFHKCQSKHRVGF